MKTESLCPVCLERVEATYVERPPASGDYYLVKRCPQHGEFCSPAWLGQPPFTGWRRPKRPSYPRLPYRQVERGCPYDCGLCPEHKQHTCTGLIEITSRCDLGCPICYAGSGAAKAPADPSLDNIALRLERLWAASGACNIQLSGGEPTLREDLPQIIALARRRGFPFILVNSNGLRLAQPGYAAQLAAAGLDSIYLQFDGPDDEVFRSLRGRELLRHKLTAVEACAEAGLGVVLVATLVRGVNFGKLGDLLRLALSLGPVVRGLHLQPAASFGRYPWALRGGEKLTLPEVMRALAEQAPELVNLADFHPPGCENALCSFSAVYRRLPQGGLAPAKEGGNCCAPPPVEEGAPPQILPLAEDGARAAKSFTARHWAAPKGFATLEPDLSAQAGTPCTSANPATPAQTSASGSSSIGTTAGAASKAAVSAGEGWDDFDRFLARAGLDKRFTLSCMAFQDAMGLDLERTRGCCIHVVNGQGELIPFCLYNLSAEDGGTLYRRADGAV